MKIVSKVLAVAFVLMTSVQPSFAQMRLSSTGAGEVLIFPYYTAANGNQTDFVIYNTSPYSKALYLRFREGLSGAEVIGFNLYLAPDDSFEGAIIQNPDGSGGALVTRDTSCTVPLLGDGYAQPPGSTTMSGDNVVTRVQPFFNWTYIEDSDQSMERTLTGSLEVFDLGQWTSSGGGYSPVAPEIEKGASGDIAGCEWLVQQWSTGGIFRDDPSAYAAPWAGGGISGEMRVYQPYGFGAAPNFSIEPVVIDGFAKNGTAGEYHGTLLAPDDEYPSAHLKNGTLDVLSLETGARWSANSGLDAVSMLLATTEVSLRRQGSDETHSTNTVAIVTFPTKYFHSGAAVQAASRQPAAPFETKWDSGASAACETIGIRPSTSGNRLHPYGDVASLEACGAINVLYSAEDPALGVPWLAQRVDALRNNPAVISFSSRDFESPSSERFVSAAVGETKIYGMPAIIVPVIRDLDSGEWKSMTLLKTVLSSDTTGSDGSGESDSSDSSGTATGDGTYGSSDQASSDGGSNGDSDSDSTCTGFGCGYDTDPTDSGSSGGDSDTGGGSGAGVEGDGGGNTVATGPFQAQLNLESPRQDEVYSGIGTIQGWAIDSSGKLGSSIGIYVDGAYRGEIAHGDSRGDVGSAFPNVANSRLSGFSAAFNFGELEPGWHVLELVAADSRGGSLRSSVSFYVARFGEKTFLTGGDAPRATGSTSCRMVESRIRCSEVLVGGDTYSMWLDWNTATQNFEITRIQD